MEDISVEKFVIAITRTCGSGAMTISKELAKYYGINIYDRKLLRLASENSGINEALFAHADEKIKNTILYRVSKTVYNGELIAPESDNFTSDLNLFNYQAKVLKELAKSESYIVIGRAADYILKDMPLCISVYLWADMEDRIKHMMDLDYCTEKEAEKNIEKNDKFRLEYYKYHTGRNWKNTDNYDLCLNTSKLGMDKCVEIIKKYIEFRIENTKN